MNKFMRVLISLSILSVVTSACTQASVEPTVEVIEKPVEETEVVLETESIAETETQEQTSQKDNVLYVNLTWHQHQPLYYKDTEGIYTRPWVRAHATKDYLDMAQKVAEFEDIHVSFNFTPSLIRQLNDLSSGAKDKYWVLGEKSVSELTDADKRFILERFFDANWTNIIGCYPRFQALLNKRGGSDEASIQAALDSFTDQDFLDLQVWFNLAWFDPAYLAEAPLVSLVEKGEGFDESDKEILFTKVLEVLRLVIPYHKHLQDSGQIEVTTTPYGHPILPLIFDNQLALVGNPSADMPSMRFSYPQDADVHLAKSVDMYEENFGRGVRGLWPGEGSVAQEIVPLIAGAGYTYMQSGEPVLAKSLGINSFTRDSQGFVLEADDLYRPYMVGDESGNQVAIFFRDWTLSDSIGFVYTGMSGEEGSADLVSHLEAIQVDFIENGTPGPHIVSIILDGENAWEYYPNDGNDFLKALYQKLSESESLQMVTPSEYLEMFPEQRILDDLFPGAWFSANYDTWIGETEEAIAWNYLAQVREDLAQFETGEITVDENALAAAFDFMYLAEGSDWFWWYGDDQDSGQDSYFDEGFRALLAGVYQSLGEEVPLFLQVLIIQAQPVTATRPFSTVSTPKIDGISDAAWDSAAYYQIDVDSIIKGVYATLDKENIYLRLDVSQPLVDEEVGFYFNITDSDQNTSAFGDDQETMLGFNANKLIKWTGDGSVDIFEVIDEGWDVVEPGVGSAANSDTSIEISLPLVSLGELSAGDRLKFNVVFGSDGDIVPVSGPAQITMPDLGEGDSVLVVKDPVGDDFGPGTYTYPTEGVFKESVFDVDLFTVGYDTEDLILAFEFVGPIENPWGSSIGLSIQTMDVYIDIDPGSGTGARMLLPGRNAALVEGSGWDIAVWAEGWSSQVVQVDPETLAPKNYTEASSAMKIIVDPAQNAVVIRVPLVFLGEGDPVDWAYAAVVLGQEGYPAEGVWRVRDIAKSSAQYLFGGGPSDANHTRIIDLILAEDAQQGQAEILSNYPSSQDGVDGLGPDDFAQVPMLFNSED
ncbi:MAG: glucodextranase DOMON-like domain-containing protein [Chloroflexota bacterium]|nr:glucodextranase DOMON-like domain-containing protein [Chloroflexota bacterium]